MLITNEAQRSAFIAKANKVDLSKKSWLFEAKPFEPKRSDSQNRLLNLWYTEIGKQSGNGFSYERNFYKFTYGAPILVRDNQEFAEFYGELVANLEHEMCIQAIQFIQVSSIMKVKQFTEYLNNIDQNSIERGFHLSKPDDIYFQAMGIK